MISLKRLIMNPASPDKALQQAYSQAEGAPARIAHVNRLSRDVNDIKYYEADLQTGTSAILRIFSKKGIVDVINYDATAAEFTITLQNSEITQDREKFYIQLTAYTTGSAVPVMFGIGAAPDTFNMRIVDVTAAQDWGDLYFYYEMVKID
jgi:hypothetical protein